MIVVVLLTCQVKMASSKTYLCVLSMAFVVQIAMGVDYLVGGRAGGWDINVDLSL